MKTKAFLKIDRMDSSGILCLRFWLEVFKNYETYILCDRETDLLETVQKDYPQAKLIQSDRTVIAECCTTLKSSKRNMAAANLTGFKLSQNADAFWMIDADYTMFLSHAYDRVQEKLRIAEQQFVERELDAYSLDFYRNHNNGWTFGVALIRTNISMDLLASVQGPEMRDLNFARNIDTVFHVLWKKEQLKCANFVFTGIAFQHTYNNYPLMPQGVYYWNKGCLWEAPLQPDVVTI